MRYFQIEVGLLLRRLLRQLSIYTRFKITYQSHIFEKISRAFARKLCGPETYFLYVPLVQPDFISTETSIVVYIKIKDFAEISHLNVYWKNIF